MKEEEVNKENFNPYCPYCESCGEEGCCSPLSCKQQEGGHYCDTYLKTLKFNYYLHREFIELLYKDKEKNKDLLSAYDTLYDEVDNKFYGTKEENN